MSRPLVLIDDSATQIQFIQGMLEKSGYTVHSYVDQEEAIKGIESHHPALILCDYIMPDRNGVDFCKYLKSKDIFDDGFFLIITDSMNWGEFRADFHDLPDGWIAKRLPEEEFMEKVNKWYAMVP
jgi:sigma-B regulation protein RsbU (phosphoserine phosphatase)